MNDRQYATWTTDSMQHERRTVCDMNDRQYATQTTGSMPHERQTVCHKNDSMWHERLTVCDTNDRQYATWTIVCYMDRQYASHDGFRTYRPERLNILCDATCHWMSSSWSCMQTRCLNPQVQSVGHLGLIEPEDEGTVFLWTIRNHSLSNTV